MASWSGLDLAFLQQRQHFLQHRIDRPHDGHVGIDGLGDGRRIDIDMDNSRARTELFGAIGHPIIKPRTDGQDQIRMVHGHIGLISAMHTEHAQELLVSGRISTQPHQRIGDGKVQRAGQFSQLPGRLPQDDATAGIDDRPLGGQQHIHGLFDLAGVTANRRVVGTQLDLACGKTYS